MEPITIYDNLRWETIWIEGSSPGDRISTFIENHRGDVIKDIRMNQKYMFILYYDKSDEIEDEDGMPDDEFIWEDEDEDEEPPYTYGDDPLAEL